MPVIYRFKSNEDFEESCFKLGIPWIPPYVLKLNKTQKQIWQRKVLSGKIKVVKPPESDKAFLNKYKQCVKEATRVNGRVDIDSLPPDVRARFLMRRERKRASHKDGNIIKEFDTKIFLHKWYPWSYDINGKPAVVLQGFYSIKAARKRFLLYYGKESLEHVHWIKGRSALERGFLIGRSLLIDGKRKKPISKILLTENYRKALRSAKKTIGRELSKKKKLKSQPKERYLLNLVDKFNYGTKEYRTLLQAPSEEHIRLSTTKATEAKRKKALYEEE